MTDIETLHADLTRAKQEMVDPVPTMAPAPDCSVELIRGLPHHGKMQTLAEVRELTGRDEEQLARYKRVEDYFDGVIALGTVKVGELDLSPLPLGERQGLLRQLLVCERDAVYLNVAKATYGDTRTYPITCNLCKREQDLTVSITDDFKVDEVAKSTDVRNFKHTTSKGFEVEVRLATGSDQLEVLKKDGITVAEMNTIMLSNCIVSVNGGMVVDPPAFARELPMRDRQALAAELVKRQPSIDLDIKYTCIGCQEEQQASFGWLDFFRAV